MTKLPLAILKIVALISLKALNTKNFNEIFDEHTSDVCDLITWMIIGGIIADEKTEIKLAKILAKGIKSVVWYQEDDTTTVVLVFKGGLFKVVNIKGNKKLKEAYEAPEAEQDINALLLGRVEVLKG